MQLHPNMKLKALSRAYLHVTSARDIWSLIPLRPSATPQYFSQRTLGQRGPNEDITLILIPKYAIRLPNGSSINQEMNPIIDFYCIPFMS